MDAFAYLAAPIPPQESTPESSSSPSEVPEVFVDQDTFGFVGVHSGCVIA
nr:pheromone precursor [Ganoderma boninense]